MNPSEDEMIDELQRTLSFWWWREEDGLDFDLEERAGQKQESGETRIIFEDLTISDRVAYKD